MKGWKDDKKGIGEEVGLYIGRFNPPHLGHESILFEMLHHRLDTIIVAIGGATGARTFKNPWNFAERSIMINLAFEAVKERMKKISSPSFEMPNTKLRIIGIPDYISDYRWQQDIRVRVEGITTPNDNISIYGYEKDSSSYYLKLFPEWNFVGVNAQYLLDATTVREKIYKNEFNKEAQPNEYNDMQMVSGGVLNFINGWVESDEFNQLRREWEFINTYKRQFEGLKHKPVFITVDALFVTRKKEVVLIERKEYPGLGTLAMPGGFVYPDLTLRQSLNRILEKKLGIDIGDIKHTRLEVIDNPDRSLRGRTITNVFVFENFKYDGMLRGEPNYYPIGNLGMYRQQMFEDHFMIIDHLMY
jgi:bifunctional NMN adenylyltransferase/nudix hydrolase